MTEPRLKLPNKLIDKLLFCDYILIIRVIIKHYYANFIYICIIRCLYFHNVRTLKSPYSLESHTHKMQQRSKGSLLSPGNKGIISSPSRPLSHISSLSVHNHHNNPTSWFTITKYGLIFILIFAILLLGLTAYLTLSSINSRTILPSINEFVSRSGPLPNGLRGTEQQENIPPLDLTIPREVIITVPDRPRRGPFVAAAAQADSMISSRASETDQFIRQKQEQKLQQQQQQLQSFIDKTKSDANTVQQSVPQIQNQNTVSQQQNTIPIPDPASLPKVQPPPPPPGIILPPNNPFTNPQVNNNNNNQDHHTNLNPKIDLPFNLPPEALPPHLRKSITSDNTKNQENILPPTRNENKVTIPHTIIKNDEKPHQYGKDKRAFFFTMDTLSDYITGASKGGAAGELIVREGLMWALESLGYTVVIAHSDPEMFQYMENNGANNYDLLFFDPWTLVDPTNRVRKFLYGKENHVFVLAFFGWNPTGRFEGFNLPTWHVLTAYPTDPLYTFLGFVVHPNHDAIRSYEARHPTESSNSNTNEGTIVEKINGGTIWGKKAEYFTNREEAILAAAKLSEVHIVAKDYPLQSDLLQNVQQKIKFHGSMNKEEWQKLITSSKYLLGLGNPLLGPSALDALASGTMYIDPIYDKVRVRPTDDSYLHMVSQHPYLKEKVGEPYVCSVNILDKKSVEKCIEKALVTDLKPFIPPDFTKPYLLDRVTKIIEKKLEEA